MLDYLLFCICIKNTSKHKPPSPTGPIQGLCATYGLHRFSNFSLQTSLSHQSESKNSTHCDLNERILKNGGGKLYRHSKTLNESLNKMKPFSKHWNWTLFLQIKFNCILTISVPCALSFLPADSLARPLWESPVVDGHKDDLSSHFPIQPFLPRPGNHPDPQLAQPGLPHSCINTPKLRFVVKTVWAIASK